MADTGLSRLELPSFIKILFPLLPLWLLLWPLSVQGSPISLAPERHRPAPGLADGHGGIIDPSLLEQDSEGNMKSLLESLRDQFLQTFNLSGPPAQLPGSARVEPPEYMMELYNRFATDHTAMPTANIIRSFKNEDLSPCSVGTGGERQHPLLFNVSIPHHERITAAELRLYTLVQTDRNLYAGVDRKVTIYELERQDKTEENNRTGKGTEAGAAGGREELVELASRQVYGTDNGWEAFDLSSAVQRWRKSESGTTHRLEVHIASLGSEEQGGQTQRDGEGEGRKTFRGNMDIDTSPEDKHKPLMIIFSDDQSGDHRDDKRELNEMIGHETSAAVLQGDLTMGLNGLRGELGQSAGADEEEDEQDEEDLIQMRSNLIYDTASRIRRNVKGSQCKKQSLYVEFKDIGWDSWILAPAGYEAFECSGVCTYPLTKHVTPTKHAIVQTLVSMKSPQRVSRACCVPTKLDPISLLYLDDTGVVTYKYKFEGMVVAECGCR
ncbi:bone morphogenetic protein 10 [Esox lucius]|uniref:TGF-beta family profile domain-containing protein n=1 Tax=Esox lucius TaxID=8010 RepID=A0AAY5L4W9_ESOLU|nr:bone morphogenetic protein 10 [Esox lucius]